MEVGRDGEGDRMVGKEYVSVRDDITFHSLFNSSFVGFNHFFLFFSSFLNKYNLIYNSECDIIQGWSNNNKRIRCVKSEEEEDTLKKQYNESKDADE